MPVVAILGPNSEETDNQVCVLSDILGLPAEVLDYIQKRMPTFQFRNSRTVGGKYFANTCPHCGSLFGDFYLHSEAGAPFFPTDEKEAGLLYLREIPFKGLCVFN